MIQKILTVLVGLSVLGGGCSRLPQEETGVQAGIAVVDITPPIGYRMSGYFRERPSTGVSNPLKAKALVLRQGEARIAWVASDIIGLSSAVSRQARALAEQATGIPAQNVLLSATHTHTGPLYSGALRDHFHAQAVALTGKDPLEEIDYGEFLAGRISEAIQLADQRIEPVQIDYGSAHQEGLSFNRRFRMRDGTVRFNPGVLNPDIVEAMGPIDPEVGIVSIRSLREQSVLALIVNFALHLDTVGGNEYGADYPYVLEKKLRESLNDELVLFFGTGTCGDINHIDVTRKERLSTEEIGTRLSETVISAVPDLKAVSAPALGSRSQLIRVPLQSFDPGQVEWARGAIAQVGTPDLPFLKQVEAYKILAVQALRSEQIALEIQVFRLGPELALVGLPGEVFVDLGLQIKAASPFGTTLVVELCQDAPGYIPTEKAFSEGSYETVNSRIVSGGGEQMAAAAIDLLASLAE